MRHHSWTLTALLLIFAGCGELPADEGAIESATEVRALQTCNASCDPPTYNGVPVSCTGNTCSAAAGSVTCDGVSRFCLPAPVTPPPTCEPEDFCTTRTQCDSVCGGDKGSGRCVRSCCVCL